MIPPFTCVLLYIPKWHRRVIVQTPTLKKGDPVYLIFGFCDNINSTLALLAFNLLLTCRPSHYRSERVFEFQVVSHE
jgi:hypothetical protein